jgi:hypothetical protein
MPDKTEASDSEPILEGSGSTCGEPPINVSSPGSADPESSAPPRDDATAEQPTASAEAGAEPDADDFDNFHEFCAIIRSCTAPLSRSHKWQFLDEQTEFLRIEMPPAEFVAALEQDGTTDGLIGLGYYERAGEELRLPSWLDGDANLYVQIDKIKRTIKYSRGDGFLFPMKRTALDCAMERIPQDSAQATDTLFVVTSEDSVEVMQRLGLPAVSGEGLGALGIRDIERLFNAEQRTDCAWRFYLLLVDFDVARLDNRPTAIIGEVIDRLAAAANLYGIDPARRFGVSRPSADEFHLLEQAISFQDSSQIGELFKKWSAAAKSATINNWQKHFDAKAPTFSVTRAELAHALRETNVITRRVKVLDAYSAYRLAACGTVLPKLCKDVDRASDPFDQLDLIAAVGYAEAFFNSDPLVRAAEAILEGQTPPSIRELEDESLQQRQRYLTELRRIYRDRKAKR